MKTKNQICETNVYDLAENSFESACYNDNAVQELIDALVSGDYGCGESWKLTRKNQKKSIIRALEAKINELAENTATFRCAT